MTVFDAPLRSNLSEPYDLLMEFAQDDACKNHHIVELTVNKIRSALLSDNIERAYEITREFIGRHNETGVIRIIASFHNNATKRIPARNPSGY